MPPLDGYGRSEIALFLQLKPNLDGQAGLHENSSAERVHDFRQSLRIANHSIYIIDIGCMQHESGYNVYCKSFLVYGERPCTISHEA